MKMLVISDIHANLEAFEAVLADAPAHDAIWFLGDIVGYGPDPNACMDRLMALEPAVWLAGNHDWAALGHIDLKTFNPEARLAAEWTARELRPQLRDYLDSLKPAHDQPDAGLTLVHGSPRHPIWEYILDAGVARENFDIFKRDLCFFGHTHVPVIFEEAVDGVLRHSPRFLENEILDSASDLQQPDSSQEIEEAQSAEAIIERASHTIQDARTLVNPGSVGQPPRRKPPGGLRHL